MTEAERKLLRAYKDANGAISRENFVSAFPDNPVLRDHAREQFQRLGIEA